MSARRRVAVVCAAIAALLIAAIPPAMAEQTPSAQETSAAGVWVRLANGYGAGNHCLEATGGHDGAHARVWPCDGSSEQDWMRGGDGTLRNSRYPTKCLDADVNGGGANGTYVQTWECNGSAQQRWPTRANDVALYNERFLNNYNTVLDRNINWSGNGAPVQLWQKNFQPQQYWTFF